jgi:ribose-phosphate pyrophosphokinase
MQNESLINPHEVRFFSGSSHPLLAQNIANYLGIPLDPTKIKRFSNDNLYIQLGASVRSRKVFIVQSLFAPVNDHLVELLIMLNAARMAAATEVHAIIPYFSFARSDKKDAPRISITARLIADLLQTSGATHVMTMMLHSPQVHGFFGIPNDHLNSRKVFQEYFTQGDLSDTIVVAPDLGQAKHTTRFAKDLGLDVAAGIKERKSDTEVMLTGFVGDLTGKKRAIIYDDEIATGGSVVEICKELTQHGIEEIRVACTHGVFVRGGLERLTAIPEITEIVTTDTVHIPVEKRGSKLRVLSVAHVFGEAIRRNIAHNSLGDLFVFSENP